MPLRGSYRAALVYIAAFMAITFAIFLVPGLDNIDYVKAQTQPQNYTVNIRIGASVPSMQVAPQSFYDPPVLPINTTEKGIPAKSIVTWINDDESYHTVTSGDALRGPDRLFDSGILSPKVPWSYTFSSAGEYNYYCTVHPFMRGLVKVTG
jgi:hypothetical protein